MPQLPANLASNLVPMISLQPNTPNTQLTTLFKAAAAAVAQQHNKSELTQHFQISHHSFASGDNHSPGLTPGRKSASPTFFHSSYFASGNHHQQQQFYGNNTGSGINLLPPNHQFFQNQQQQMQHYNDSVHEMESLNHHHGHHHDTQQNFNGIYQLDHLFSGGNTSSSSNSTNLKLPTTPTRSKSLSPSLRDIVQPARIRFKQQNQNSRGQNNQGESDNYRQSKTITGANCYFEPIAATAAGEENNSTTSKIVAKSSNNANDGVGFRPPPTTNNDAQNQSIGTKTIDNDQKISRLYDPEKQNVNKNSQLDSKSLELKKPLTVLSAVDNYKISHENENKRPSISIDENDNKINNDTTFKFKLPFNARKINLNNFPPNQAINSKRQYSLSMQKIRLANTQNSDKSMNTFKKNIQFILNEEFKAVIERMKKEYLEPAVRNIQHNNGTEAISHEDIIYFILDMLDEARNSYSIELVHDSMLVDGEKQPRKRKSSSTTHRMATGVADSSSPSTHNDDSSDENNCIQTQVVCKKLKEMATDKQMHQRNTRNVKFGKGAQFVLGKNVNELYVRVQQTISLADESSTASSTTKTEENIKNGLDDILSNPAATTECKSTIYSRYPKLFKYEADQIDRHWLNEHAIIKRKNLKCYLLALDDIVDVFKASLKLATDVEVFDRVSQAFLHEDNAESSSNGRELFLKKLKPFSLPDFILYKLNRQYFKRNIKS